MTQKKKNYDYTANERRRRREEKYKAAGLSFLKVPMHKDDGPAVRAYAEKLYNKRGIYLD